MVDCATHYLQWPLSTSSSPLSHEYIITPTSLQKRGKYKRKGWLCHSSKEMNANELHIICHRITKHNWSTKWTKHRDCKALVKIPSLMEVVITLPQGPIRYKRTLSSYTSDGWDETYLETLTTSTRVSAVLKYLIIDFISNFPTCLISPGRPLQHSFVSPPRTKGAN